MANVVVVGAQWGDEGKGKIVDWLSERADVIARFQGGHNAGHTLVIDGVVFKLSLLPSGILREGKLAVIGNGVVLDPWALLQEIKKISQQGVKISTDNLIIAENTPLILPVHQDLDKIREDAAGKSKIGKNSKVSHLSYVGDANVGQNSNIGAGTITCNYDGVKKNKTNISDNVFIGSNTSLVAPIKIDKNSTVGAGSVITKNVKKNSLALTRPNQQEVKNYKRKK